MNKVRHKYALAASSRKAGPHGKTKKAIRRRDKVKLHMAGE